jgi:hypothetical protein
MPWNPLMAWSEAMPTSSDAEQVVVAVPAAMAVELLVTAHYPAAWVESSRNGGSFFVR